MKSDILHRILVLISTLISMSYVPGNARFCNYRQHKTRFNKSKKHKDVPLCGTSLMKFYNKKIESSVNDSDLAIRHLFELAEMAHYKKKEERTRDEAMALSVVESACTNFLQTIFRNYFVFASGEIAVLMFGGIVDAGGTFLENILNEYISKFNKPQHMLNLIFSRMGDKRAILGAVDHAMSILHYKSNNDYAVGIDIGGTNIRIGVVKLSDFSLVGNLLKESVFVDNSDKDAMKRLIPKMRDFYNNSEKDNKSLEEQKILGDILIKRICNIIDKLKEDYKVRFIAISSAGYIKNYGFFDYVCQLPFTGINLKNEIESILNIPVFIFNDIECAAFGEKKFGSLKKYNNFIVAGFGTGLAIKYFQYYSDSIVIQDILKIKEKNSKYTLRGDFL